MAEGSAAILSPRFNAGDVILTPWGHNPDHWKLVERVYQARQGGRTVTAYDIRDLDYDGRREPVGGFTEEAEGIDRVKVLRQADLFSGGGRA